MCQAADTSAAGWVSSAGPLEAFSANTPKGSALAELADDLAKRSAEHSFHSDGSAAETNASPGQRVVRGRGAVHYMKEPAVAAKVNDPVPAQRSSSRSELGDRMYRPAPAARAMPQRSSSCRPLEDAQCIATTTPSRYRQEPDFAQAQRREWAIAAARCRGEKEAHSRLEELWGRECRRREQEEYLRWSRAVDITSMRRVLVEEEAVHRRRRAQGEIELRWREEEEDARRHTWPRSSVELPAVRPRHRLADDGVVIKRPWAKDVSQVAVPQENEATRIKMGCRSRSRSMKGCRKAALSRSREPSCDSCSSTSASSSYSYSEASRSTGK
eukprot:gnl/TRDRNA2_/TRDRNA2_192034_c0_seq1.p1 gnl/TRDRNA2_/TRDRNA2_192034_c0~~gnl/TRDRNA2_/TRDRNA2_192034_c0_seq1.p1  ORF type:complete len:328 (-),score=45.03 gnl/TRDRNA2_/TRDRNA2_192034_c0_seq1:148-1131(-)